MFFNKKPNQEEIIDKQVENIIGYSYSLGMAFYKWLIKEEEDFGKRSEEYCNYFIELFTLAACGMSLHSPFLGYENRKTYAMKAFEKHLPLFFDNKIESNYTVLLDYVDFLRTMLVPCTNDGFTFSDVTGLWVLHNLQIYDNSLEERNLIRRIGKEITDHFIYIFEDTWEPLQLEPKHFL